MSEERHHKGNREERRDRAPREGEGDMWSESSSVGNREDRRDRAPREGRRDRAPGRGHREVEGDMWSERWDYNKQIIEQVRERWTEEAMGRGLREGERAVEGRFEQQRKDNRDAKTTWRGEDEGNRWKAGKQKSSSRDADRRRSKDEVKARNVVCHSISGGSSHQNKSFSSKKRESYSSPEQQGKTKRRRSGQSSSSLRSSPKPEKVKREASHSLEELENALKMVEQEEEAVATRDELKAQIEEMKKKKLQKAEEGLGDQSILVKDFTEMDEYFGKFGAIVGITKVSEGCSRIDFVDVAAAEKAKKTKDHWPQDSQEYEATRSKSVKPRNLNDISKEEGETSSMSSSEDDYGHRWACVECHHDNFSWSVECSQCAAKQQCEGQALRISELQDQGQALGASSTSELANWRKQIGEGKFGKEKVVSGEGVEKNAQGGKEINLTCDADKTVPVVDLADSSEEEIQEVEKEDMSIKEQKVEDTSSKEQTVADILESLSNASREEQDNILSKLGIVRRIVKKRDKPGMSDTLGDAGLYSDGDEETEKEYEGTVN